MDSWLTRVTATKPALLFMVVTMPLPCCVPGLWSCFPLWRLDCSLKINTITSWFGSHKLKDKIPFIQISAVFYGYSGQSVLNKTFGFRGIDTIYLFWYSCKAYLSHKPKDIQNRTAFCQRQNSLSYGEKDWKAASPLFGDLSWGPGRVPTYHLLHG